MSAELTLVTQLAIILIAAGVFTIICRALKQPLILGYIIAGFIVGPHLGLFPQLDAESVKQWSELGIIFLLFGLGLEFSFRKLIKIGSSALTTSGIICIGMFAVGFMLGQAMKWTQMESIFMGGMMSMSSTTIILKSYTDMGLKKKPWASLIFGTLVFEDLIAVLLMVLLSTMAVTGHFSGAEMFKGLVKLVFFLVLWFVVGIFLIPLILKKAKKYLDNEILLLVGIGLCFTMVVLANKVGFSSALGAFVMGSILAETIEGENIAHITMNIKDLFGAIFFVSVGMMVDPGIIADNWLPILIITIVAIAGLLVFSTAGSLLAGAGLDNAVHVGFSMAQLGEFSFIIAGLGCSLGVMREEIYPIIIAVSVITTFTTPYMIKAGDPVSQWLNRALPQKFLDKFAPKDQNAIHSKAEKNEWKNMLTLTVIRVLVYSVSIIAVATLADIFVPELLTAFFPGITADLVNWISFLTVLTFMAPLIFGLITNGSKTTDSMNRLLQKNRDNVWPLLAILIVRSALATVYLLLLIGEYFTLSWWVSLLISIGLLLLFVLVANYSIRKISLVEKTFLSNLNAKEDLAKKNAPVSTALAEAMAGSGMMTAKFVISSDCDLAGETISKLPIPKNSKAIVLKLVRGSRSFIIPSPEEKVYPGDKILIAGTHDQIAAFKAMIEAHTVKADEDVSAQSDFAVENLSLAEGNRLCGLKISDSGIRKAGCLVVGVFRNGKMIPNPPSDFVLAPGDKVWIAGEKNSLKWFN